MSTLQVADQDNIDHLNAEFWNYLCGSGLAQHLGIQDNTSASLKKFDDEYFRIYPYLSDYVNLESLQGKKVLEVGLGYGTLGNYIAQNCSEYHGLDISQGPVDMMNHRLEMLNLPANAKRQSVLNCPHESNSFDVVVSIGCYHHTGNLQGCFDETYRVLKPGGKAIMMVYNRYSFRQWQADFYNTLFHALKSRGITRVKNVKEETRKAYDADLSGNAAPETVLSSKKELRQMLKKFKNVKLFKENCDGVRSIPREKLLGTLGKLLGLDIYIVCTK